MNLALVFLSLVVLSFASAGCVKTPLAGDGSEITGDIPPADNAADEGAIAAAAKPTARVAKVGASAHRVLQNKQESDEFVKLAVMRQRLTQDLQVFSRVTNEKKAEVDLLERTLDKEFGIDPRKVYQYETKTRNLFEIRKADAAAAGVVSTNQVTAQRALLKTIREGDEEKRFLGLSTRKELSSTEYKSIRIVTEEKRKKLGDVLTVLQQKYGIDGKKNYSYDAATMTIREVVGR
jgi:hypothetical protein